MWGFRCRRKGFNSAGLGGKKEAVTIEHVVRDVFTDGALGLGSLIGDWKWGPERKGKKRKRKARKGRKKKEVTSG